MRRTLVVFALASLVGCGGSVSTGDDTDSGGIIEDSSVTGGDTGTVTDGVVSKDGTPTDAIAIDGSKTDSTSTGDTTTNPGDAAIACGTTSCDPATQECCLTFGGGGGGAACIDKGATCAGATVDCTKSAAGPSGEVCCGSRDPTGGFSATCASDCTGGQQLCATDAECPSGERCRTIFGGIKICRTAFDGGGFDGAGFDTAGFDTAGFGG